MINIMKADIYRILRGKAIYVTLFIMIAIISLNIFSSSNLSISIGVKTDAMDIDYTDITRTGAIAARMLLMASDTLAYFMIPIFSVIAATMFSCGAVKNSLSIGISRTKLYLSKWILSSIMCVVLFLISMIIGIVPTTIIWGFGDWGGGYFLTILQAMSAQIVILLAFTSIGVFIVFVTRNAGAVTGIYLAFALVPALLTVMIGIENYYNYDLGMCIKLFSFIEILSRTEILRGLFIGIGYIIISTTVGIMLFRRAEIK